MDLSAYYSPIAQVMEQNPIRPSWTMQRPGVIPLAYGFPDPDSFPYDGVADATSRLMAQRRADVLQYGPVAGPEPLREFVADWLNRTEALGVTAANIMITSGASQAIVLATRLLVPSGGTVLVESPTFIGALWFLRGLGVEIVGLPMDRDGLEPTALRDTVRALRADGRQVRLVYTMPTVHNPLGFSMPTARRQELARIAQELDLIYLEDDAYGDLILEGERPASLYRTVGAQRVIKLGTFSKLVAGGMRLGWAVAGPEDIVRMSGLKSDNATSPFAAWVTAEYLASGALDERVPALRDLYRGRRDALLNGLAPLRELGCSWPHPTGGFFVWLSLPEGHNSETLQPTAEARGVTYLAGRHCFANGLDRRHLRLAYSYLPTDQIEEGARRLVSAIRASAA